MRFADLLGLALSALWQQKVRTALTVFGVLIGTAVLTLSLSVGRGVEAAILRQFRQNHQLRKIDVRPQYAAQERDIPAEALRVPGAMSEAKRQRIRKALVSRWGRKHSVRPKVLLTRERLRAMAKIEHVAAVVPSIRLDGRAIFAARPLEAVAASVAPEESTLRARIVAGDDLLDAGGRSALVHEYLLYRWGIVRDEDVRGVLGKTLRLEYRAGLQAAPTLLAFLSGGRVSLTPDEETTLAVALQRLPSSLATSDLSASERAVLLKVFQGLPTKTKPGRSVRYSEDFVIRGVVREWTESDPQPGWGANWLDRDADLFLPTKAAEEFFLRAPEQVENGFDQVTVTVDREENVKQVTRTIAGLGLYAFSLADIIEQLRTNVLLIGFATAFVAAAALLVAALGITNTMAMSVLERTREIGVMKAVGARERHIRWIFLVEGALIGALGGGLGLLLSWLASLPGNAVAQRLMEKQTQTPVRESLFAFPLWLTLGIPALSGLITTLAALYPARRAARLDPITSLRHE